MKVGDLAATVFGMGRITELSDTHAWIELLDGTMVGAPQTQVTVVADG